MARRSCRIARSKVVKMKMSRRNLTKLTGAASIGLPAGFTHGDATSTRASRWIQLCFKPEILIHCKHTANADEPVARNRIS